MIWFKHVPINKLKKSFQIVTTYHFLEEASSQRNNDIVLLSLCHTYMIKIISQQKAIINFILMRIVSK